MQNNIQFVGLHGHSTIGSPFDSIGYPSESMETAFSNDCKGLALTDHGNMNGFSYQFLHWKKMQSEGKTFKPIFGNELYVIPSLNDWRQQYEASKTENKEKKKTEEVDEGTLVVEDESATKKATKNPLKHRRHLVVLAQNQEGLYNLFKLTSLSYNRENFYFYPRIDFDLLKQYNKGLIISSACMGGILASGPYWQNKEDPNKVRSEMSKVIEQMMDIFGDRFYGELQWNNSIDQHNINQYIIELSKIYGFKLISTADSHYPSPEMWKDRELYKRLGFIGKKKAETEFSPLPNTIEEVGYELYPKNGIQMWQAYKKYSKFVGIEYNDNIILDSIERTHEIAFNQIDDFVPDTSVRLPSFVVPTDVDEVEMLSTLAIQGLKSKGLHIEKEYVNRLKYELKVIKARSFSKYFLTMKAIVDKAKETQLIGPGRGSVGGSLLAYVLGITRINPIKYKLPFERMILPNQTSFPDIDTDFADPVSLKESLISDWGTTSVVPISNFNTLKLRSLIKDIGKYYDIPFQEVNDVTSKMIIEATPQAKQDHDIKSGVYDPTFEEVVKYSQTLRNFFAKYPFIQDRVKNLEKQTRSLSRHAGGVVVGEELDKYMPLISNGEFYQTPWCEGQKVKHLESLGFIKFDLLGLETLRIIQNCIVHILQRHHQIENPTFQDIQKFFDDNLHEDKINLEDQAVFENIFHKGNFAATFQFTQSGVQDYCMKCKPLSIADLAAISSVYRPGPLSMKADLTYFNRKEGLEQVTYIHPLAEEILQETHGVLLYQEQISLLAHKLGDMSLADGTKFMKLYLKKGIDKKDLEKYEKKFIKGCTDKGILEKDANEFLEYIRSFAQYGFSKNHVFSYILVTYLSAYLLNYFPAEWLAAYLDVETDEKKGEAIAAAKKFGFDIQKPNINTSGLRWQIKDNTLVQPLLSVKGVGEIAIEQILDNKPFNTIEELLFNENIKYSKLNKKVLDSLCRIGALDNLIDNRFKNLRHFWLSVVVDRPKTIKKLESNIELYQNESEFSKEEKLRFQIDLLSFFPIEDVVSQNLIKKLEEKYILPLGKYEEAFNIYWFVVTEIITKKTSKGKDYWILRCIDNSSNLTEIKIFGIMPVKDHVYLNRPYMAKVEKNDFGFSIRRISDMKMIG